MRLHVLLTVMMKSVCHQCRCCGGNVLQCTGVFKSTHTTDFIELAENVSRICCGLSPVFLETADSDLLCCVVLCCCVFQEAECATT